MEKNNNNTITLNVVDLIVTPAPIEVQSPSTSLLEALSQVHLLIHRCQHTALSTHMMEKTCGRPARV